MSWLLSAVAGLGLDLGAVVVVAVAVGEVVVDLLRDDALGDRAPRSTAMSALGDLVAGGVALLEQLDAAEAARAGRRVSSSIVSNSLASWAKSSSACGQLALAHGGDA